MAKASRTRSKDCYHCGSSSHRAKDCPKATCRLCRETGHDVGGCPERVRPPVDLGCFKPLPGSFKFSYIELFAGIGGFRVALDRLGGHCVFASEVDRFARANYVRNHGDRPAGDITKISEEDIPDHDLLVGGFPCQAFSSSGSRQGFNDERGVLFLEIVRILRARRPKAILLENVRGLLTHEDGDAIQVILGQLEESGYNMRYKVIDAVGILPQERKRIYLVGIRKHLDNGHYTFPSLPDLRRGFGDIMEKKLDPTMEDKLQLSDHQLQKVRNQSYTQKFPDARFLDDIRCPTKTLQSSYASYMVGSQFVPVDPKSPSNGWRRLSPREAARLQGFPETFALCRDRPYHLLGNAVIPSIIALVVAPLVCILDGSQPKDKVDHLGWQVAETLLLEAVPNDERRVWLQEVLKNYDTSAPPPVTDDDSR